MGKRYVQHSDLCGCERCAREWDRENPRPVFDEVEDPSICDGCGADRHYCRCWEYPPDDYDDYEDVEAA
jgi:hypothetical protein